MPGDYASATPGLGTGIVEGSFKAAWCDITDADPGTQVSIAHS